jgi:hypothetical protein
VIARDELKPRYLATAFLVAGSLILFQVSFTRLVSYKLFYHFVFFAISLSLLGLGAAGTYVAVRRAPADLDARIRRWVACAVLSVPVAFLLIANPFGVAHHPPIRTKLLGADAIAYLFWCAPLMIWLNFCGGVVLTSLFARFSERMGRLYAADLVGAGAGSLACVALMKYGSPPVAFVAGAGIAHGGALAVPARARGLGAGTWPRGRRGRGRARALGVHLSRPRVAQKLPELPHGRRRAAAGAELRMEPHHPHRSRAGLVRARRRGRDPHRRLDRPRAGDAGPDARVRDRAGKPRRRDHRRRAAGASSPKRCARTPLRCSPSTSIPRS